MRIAIVVIGRARGDPAGALYAHYARRIVAWPMTLKEINVTKRLPPAALLKAEADGLLNAIALDSIVVALDERGAPATSAEFAERLRGWQDAGARDLTFLVGGADGLHQSVRERAQWVLAFGALTWPHLMVRAMIAEQIYRAQQILAGHPYHRA